MKNLEVVRLDPLGNEVLHFRKEIVEQEHNSTMDAYNNVDFPEDAYKFAHKKWNKTHFDTLYGMRIDGQLAAICGVRVYDQNLRFGMMYYLLKRFSSDVRSSLWIDEGFWDTAVFDYPDVDYSFMTIYPHNRKLYSWLKALSRGRGYGQIGSNEVIDKLRTLTVHPEPFKFNGVNQYFVYRKENINTPRTPQDIIESIKDDDA